MFTNRRRDPNDKSGNVRDDRQTKKNCSTRFVASTPPRRDNRYSCFRTFFVQVSSRTCSTADRTDVPRRVESIIANVVCAHSPRGHNTFRREGSVTFHSIRRCFPVRPSRGFTTLRTARAHRPLLNVPRPTPWKGIIIYFFFLPCSFYFFFPLLPGRRRARVGTRTLV